MANNQERKPQSHLINILKATKDHHPNFALFLGAGASCNSGVKMASEMIKDWYVCCHEMYEPTKDRDKYLKSQTWYKTQDEYSVLFELLYDQPSQRREFIENCVKGASPSWGYIYLVNLLKNSVFNSVFTTNFDDLLNEACYQFSDDVRPIVCAHDSSIRSIRITSKRPKIIKLHGDFLFDNIKNTVSELETLEDNMKDKFKQFATEYGLIFVGYSGHDRSVMDTLNLLLKSESNFPHGVYWCVRKNEELSRNVDLLSRFPKFKLVEIEGFDEFFADAHASLDLNLQPELSDPYTSLAKKLNNLIENTKIPEPVPGKISQIQKDIDSIGRKISLQTGSVKTIDPDTVDSIGIDAGDVQLKMPVPFELLSQLAKRSGDYHKALDYLLREIESRPSAFVFDEAIKLLSDDKVGSYRSEDVMAKLRKAKDVLVEHPNIAFNMAISLINAKMYDFADEVLDLGIEASKRPGAPKDFNMDFYTLNRLQIKAHKSLSFELEEKSQLVEIKEHGEELSRIGALILLGDFSDAERELKVLFEQGKSPDSIGDWPIMRLLKDHVTDEDVVALLSSDSRTRPKHHVHALSAIENVSDNHNI